MPSQPLLLPTTAATTRRGITAVRSLSLFLLANILYPATIIYLFPSGKSYHTRPKPVWFPPIPVIHVATLGSSLLMGLAGWLIWADGGFTAQKGDEYSDAALPIYISQISTGVTWHPAVLRIGSAKLGWVFSLANFGFLFACYENFRRVNPIAGVLVMPALAWSVYLSFVTCYLIYL